MKPYIYFSDPKKMTSGSAVLRIKASCHCGQIHISLPPRPLFSGICHCHTCRHIHAAANVPFVAYPLDTLENTTTLLSPTSIITFKSSGKAEEYISCKTCSTTLYTKVPKLNCITVPISTLSSTSPIPLPTFHQHYHEGIGTSFDSLPKYDAAHCPTLPNTPNNSHAPHTTFQFKHHGRSKPTEAHRNCAVETSGHYHNLLDAYADNNKTNNPTQQKNQTWKDEIHQVTCACGQVQFNVRGSPDWTANCHCSVCRNLHGASFVSMCGYCDDAFDIDQKSFDQNTTMYNCKGESMENRHACNACGSWVMSELLHLRCRVVFWSNVAPTIDQNRDKDKDKHDGNIPSAAANDDRFKPACHIFYSSGIHNVHDDLPKYVGFPPLLGGTDRVMLPNTFHPRSITSFFTSCWNREARGTLLMGCMALVLLGTTPFWGNMLNDEWSSMPWSAWRVSDQEWTEQYQKLPTFLICECTMYVLALVALLHAKQNAALDLWFASWVCGTANDIFFMYLPFCDNFWQAQATIMLTPRLPLYIVCMYVALIYYSNTAARRYGLSSPLAESCLTGCLAAVLYGVYDLNGPRYLWWTWHDSDAAIYKRLGGAPIGSTMWILTYSCLCNFFYRWSTRSGGLNECRALHENMVHWIKKKNYPKAEHALKQLHVFSSTKYLVDGLDAWQKRMRSGSTVFVIMFVCVACTPAFMVLLGQFSVFSFDIAGKPGIQTLCLTCVVFVAVVVLQSSTSKGRQPSLKQYTTSGDRCCGCGCGCRGGGGGGWGDCMVGGLLVVYFLSHWWMLISFDPTTHVSTGIHQTWSSTCGNSTAYDIMGFERQDHVCGETGPRDASKLDYTWGKACGTNFLDTVVPKGEDGLVEWYTVCGVAQEPETTRMLLLVVLGVVLYGRAFLWV